MTDVVRDIGHLAKLRADLALPDAQLLERYVTGEEAAFAALVRRHGAAVVGVCRRELGCEHDSEEVFQATFLTLARRAALVTWQDSVRHWLLAVARRLSLRARRSARRPGGGGPGGGASCAIALAE